MKWLVPLLAIICLAAPAFAILGDSEAELTQRYGPQVKTGTSPLPGVTIRGYYSQGFLIVVGVLNGKSAYEMYARKNGAKLTPNELTAFMNANGAGKMWTVDKESDDDNARWVLDDGTAYAEWKKKVGSPLTIMTSEARALEAQTPKK